MITLSVVVVIENKDCCSYAYNSTNHRRLLIAVESEIILPTTC